MYIRAAASIGALKVVRGADVDVNVNVDVDVDVDRQECAKRQFLSSVLFCCAVLVGRVSCFAPCVEKKREEARKKSLWTRTCSVAAFKSPLHFLHYVSSHKRAQSVASTNHRH